MSKNSKSVKSVKVNKNTETRGPGAPQKPIKFGRGKFTVKEIKALNPSVCGLTVITRINDLVEDGSLVRLKETLATKKAGRPSFVYMTKAVWDAAQARKKASKTETVEVATVEATPETISPVPENTDENQTVNAETPAETPVVESPVTPVAELTPEAVAVGGEPVAA